MFGWLVLGGRFDGLWQRGPFTSDLFDAQARALLDGRLDVPAEVAGVEGFSVDGATHVYFGVFPALLRLPVVALSDAVDGRLAAASMLLAFALALAAAGRLAWLARPGGADEERDPRPAARWLGWFVFLVGASSPVLVLGVHTAVYFESLLWAVALTLATFERVVAATRRWSPARFAAAAALATAAMSSRASVGLAAVVAVAGLAWTQRHRVCSARARAAVAAAVLAPLVVYGVVNAARFGHPFTVPWENQIHTETSPDRQAALDATDGRLLGPQYLPTTLVQYLRPDAVRLDPLLPWTDFAPTTEVGDVEPDIRERSSSVTNLGPALLVLAVVGAVRLLRRRGDPALRIWRALALAGAAGTLGVLTIASIANRYTNDLVPLLVALAAVGLWPTATAIAAWDPGRRRAALGVLAALTVVGTLTGASLSLLSQRLQLFPSDTTIASFVDLRHRWHERLQGGPPPDAVLVDEVPALAEVPFGQVVVQERCEGVYIAVDRRWVALERGPGRRYELAGPLDVEGGELLRAGAWSLAVEDRAGERVLVAGQQGEQGVLGPAALPSGDDVHLVVEIDPVGGVLRVGTPGGWSYEGYGLPLPAETEPAEGWDALPVATPRCDRLVAALRG